MENNKDVTFLLKNISDGLKIFSIQELNQALVEILRKNRSKNVSDVDFLVSCVCQEMKISRSAVFEKYTRDETYHAKIIIFIIINEHYGWSHRKIAKKFGVFQNSVSVGIKFYKNLNPEKIKSDKEFLDKYHRCLSVFLEKITKDNNGEVL